MRLWGSATFLAAVAAAAACSDSTGSYGDGGGGGGGGRSVSVVSNAFNPSNLPVTPGGVTWTWNSGGADHNVTFQDGLGSSPTQGTGSHQRTFSAAGTYRYRCTLHSNPDFTGAMVGQVAVSSGGGGGPSPYP